MNTRKNVFSRLAELTVNSRPIIQSLSMNARISSRLAELTVNSRPTNSELSDDRTRV